MPENPNAADPETGSEYFYGSHVTMSTNANNDNTSSNNNNNNKKQSVSRVSSAGLKYYDIATQLLGKKGSDIEELFIAAARDGCYDRLENFLQRNRSDYVISVDVKDKKTGNTPLIWAAKRGHAKIVHLLLRHGADITLRNYEGQTAVEVASPTIRSLLLESVERGTEASHHLLLQAAWQGDIKVVSRLLTQKKVLDINCQNADGFTPVMLATRDIQLFERLTTQMSRPYNPVEVVSELLSARADLHAADEDGKTCLHHAAQSKATIAPSVVATIISGAPNLECKDKRSFTSVHCASLNGNADCISALLDGGSEVNARGFAGATPLHITSYNNHERATNVLLEHGANVTATDDRGLTPLDFAKTRKMKKRLQEAWAEVVNSKSTTSLAPVRTLSREDLRSSVEDLTKKRKGEVIFEGLPSNPFSDTKKDPVSKDQGLRRSTSLRELSNLRIVTLLNTWAPLGSLPLKATQGTRGLTRHSSLKDKNTKAEEENGMHLKDPVRKLGQVRNQKPAPLPRGKSRSTERLPAISPDRLSCDRNLESPVPFSRNARSRRSFEDKRQGKKPAPIPSREGSTMADDTLDRPTPRHYRSGSDPNRGTPNLLDIAASCETYLNTGGKRGRSYSVNSPNQANNLSPDSNQQVPLYQRESTMTPVQREATLMSVCSYRSDSRMSTNSSSPRLLNLGQMLCKSKTPVHNFPFGPTSSKVIPPTPTFLTQRQYSNMDNRAECDHSPRSDEETSSLAGLQRARTVFKEEFILEESRPRDPFTQSSSGSGTDTFSSSSSSRFSSPRESQTASKTVTETKAGTQSKSGTQSKTGTQTKSNKAVKGNLNQSENASKTGSKGINMSVSSKPVKLNEKFVPTVKVSAPGSNRGESVTNPKDADSGTNTNSDTSALHAMAMRNAAVLNVKSKSSISKGAKSGGSILIHGNAKELNGRNATDSPVDRNKDEHVSDTKSENTGSKVTATSNTNDSTQNTSDIAACVSKDNKENTAGAKSSEAKQKPGQYKKVNNVMQVVPTKLTENIIRTAPKQVKDKVEENNLTRTVSSKNAYTKGPASGANDAACVSNVNLKLSASAAVNSRVNLDSRQAGHSKDKYVEENAQSNSKLDGEVQDVPLNLKTGNNRAFSNINKEQTDTSGAIGGKSSNESTGKSSQTTTTVPGGNRTGSSAQTNKVGNQVHSSQVNKAGNQSNSAQANARPQSRNVNLKVTQSAGANQRQGVNVRKTSSGYTPRFSTFANKQANNEKADSNKKVESKVGNGNATVQAKVSTDNGEKATLNKEIKIEIGKKKAQNGGSDPSSPTELVPPSVCRSGSLAKSYNMAPSKNPLSKSVGNINSCGISTKSDKTSAPATSASNPTTTASISSVNSTGTTAVSKSVSQMPSVGTVSKEKTSSLLRSSSMSTIEESKEKKKLSSSDGMIKSGKVTTRRPLSDGSIVNENNAKTKNPPLVEIRTECSPRLETKKYVPSSVKIQTPLIVNPFAELEQKREEETSRSKPVSASEFGFTVEKPTIERSKTQGSMKSRNIKSAKKPNAKDMKPSSASSRISSGRRKKIKSKDSNKSDTESSRPKSGKSGKRVRSAKRKRKIPEPNLAAENEKADVALIGGIGWSVATACIDKSEADVVMVSQIDSSESDSDAVDIVSSTNPLHLHIPPNTHIQLPNSLEAPTSLSSPRFKEVRPSFGEKQRKLPCMVNDGYPPMNLDMTQTSLSQPNRSGVIIDNNIPDDISEFLSRLRHEDDESVFDDYGDDSDSGTEYDPDDQDDYEDELNHDLIAGKLTPIPESPAQTHTSASLKHVARTVDAISKFDRNIQEDDLNKMLGATPREKPKSVKGDSAGSVNSRTNALRESSGSSRSTQGKADNTSAQSNHSRVQGGGTVSRATNLSKSATSNTEGKEVEIIPKPKSSQNSVPARSSTSQRSAPKDQARKSGRNTEKLEIHKDKRHETPKVKISKAVDNDLKGDNAQVDLKKLLSEKMQSTMKMLEESHSREQRSAGKKQGEKKNGQLSAPSQTTGEIKQENVAEESIKLDINNLQGFETERKDDDLKSTRSSSRRERKFSETKVNSFDKEDDIEEVIDEIMSNTFPSRSTMKSGLSFRSGSNTLTEADRNVLKRMSQSQHQSPFYAKNTEARESVRASTSYDENVTMNKANPDFLQRFHAEDFAMGRKVKAMIDAGADTAKVRAMLKADGALGPSNDKDKSETGVQNKEVVKSDSEAKQLAKIMNSFKQMELYAGPHVSQHKSSKKETPRRDGDFKSLSKFDNSLQQAGLVSRPGSAGAGRFRKEKFTEIKESASAKTKQLQNNSAVPKDLAEEFKRSPFVQVEGSYQGVEASGLRGFSPDFGSVDAESMERPDSACTTSSCNSSVMEETIQWKKGNVLGKGAFGTVWCGLTSEGQLIAVKQIELNVTNQHKAKKEYEKVQEEVELLKTLEHRNIVGYLGTSLEDDIVSIFMQFVPGGSIASILARFGALDESVFRKYTRQILEGVEYLHSNDVIHRDIKGGNVMLMPNGVIKLIDFGCAKRLCINLSMGRSEILKSMKGTPFWMAPEVVNETGHGKKSDIWSIGCTVFEMATRKPPWAEMNPMAAIFAIGSDRPVPQLPDKFSEEAREFVNCCLNKDQIKRMSAAELLASQFIRRRMKRSTTSVS